MANWHSCADCGREIEALRKRCRDCALLAEKKNKSSYAQRRRHTLSQVTYRHERIDVGQTNVDIVTITERSYQMAFQLNPREAHVPEDEWKIGVEAHERGEDPETAIAKYRGEKAAGVTAEMEAEKTTEEQPETEKEEALPSPAKATSRPHVSKPTGK